MTTKSLLVPSLLLLNIGVIGLFGALHVQALTETTTARSTEMKRIRVSSTDVRNATNVTDPDGVCGGLAKRIVLYSVPAAGQMSSLVTKVRAAFTGSGLSQIGVIAIRAEQGGVQLSTGDIGVPHTDLTDTSVIENRTPHAGEFAFYDEDASWDIVAYFCGRNDSSDPIDISGVSQGSVDFYMMVTR